MYFSAAAPLRRHPQAGTGIEYVREEAKGRQVRCIIRRQTGDTGSGLIHLGTSCGRQTVRTATKRSVNFVDTTVKRGEIYYADLSPVVGSEQGGVRPVLIVQNDTGNRHSPTVIAAAITSQMGKAKLPTHIELQAMRYGLPKESVVLLEQVRTLDKQRLRQRMG